MKRRLHSKTQHCSLKPEFPQEGYIGFLSIVKEGSVFFLYPFNTLYRSIKEFQADTSSLKKQLSSSQLSIDPTAMLLPIHFEYTIPLIREYWTNTSDRIQMKNRASTFLTAARFFKFYKLLIVPLSLSGEKQTFSAVLPMKISTNQEQISTFLYRSNVPVDESASSAAVYVLKEPIGFNWLNGRVVKPGAVHISTQSH